jgi:Zn-finger in Ran binding protein and others
MSETTYPTGLKRRVQGDWNCAKCSNLNFAFRSWCNKCSAIRGENSSLFNSALFLVIDENTQLYAPSMKGDYSFLNTPIKITPVSTAQPKIINGTSVTRDSKKIEGILAEVKRPDVGRKGDWVCLGCKNLNFSFRQECNKCFIRKDNYIEL